MSSESKDLEAAAQKHNIGNYRRHVFLCTGPSCCTPELGQASWEELKKLHKEANLGTGDHACYRTKVGCLRICCQGPTMVVYPEGTWYANMTPERMARVVQEHHIDGKPIDEWVFAHNPLTT